MSISQPVTDGHALLLFTLSSLNLSSRSLIFTSLRSHFTFSRTNFGLEVQEQEEEEGLVEDQLIQILILLLVDPILSIIKTQRTIGKD